MPIRPLMRCIILHRAKPLDRCFTRVRVPKVHRAYYVSLSASDGVAGSFFDCSAVL